MTAKDDTEEWFKLVLKSKNMRFIVQNVEVRIANEPENFTLWKLFIEFLGQNKYKAMFQVVFRYQRLFIDDNTFDFKISSTYEKLASLQYLQSAKFFKLKAFEKSYKSKKTAPCRRYYKSPEFPQNFPFQSPLIQYITNCAQSGVLQSLYQSCKYFFDQRRQPLCYNISFGYRNILYYKNSITVGKINSSQIKNMCLTGSLFGLNYPFSDFMPKLSESRLRFIRTHMGCLSESEYDFLTKSGEIVHIFMFSTCITVNGKEDGEKIALEKLLKNLHKVKYLKLSINTVNTPKTRNELMNLKKTNKLKIFNLYVTRFAFDAKSYVKFLEENVHLSADIEIILNGVTAEERQTFETEVTKELHLTNNQTKYEPIIRYMP
uniref:Uncharacterized protein n=1 Tax=Panagrolaimus davidi TaxID=227884 RepID=A0A914QGD3_9BILA